MKSNKYFLILSTIILVQITAIAFPAKSANETTTAEMDTYVQETSPTTIFGSSSYLYVGEYSGGANTIFLHFNLNNKPSGSLGAEVSIYFYSGGSGSVLIEVYLVTGVWDEAIVTWNTVPSIGSNIASLEVTPTMGAVKFDVSEYVSGSELSLCLTSATTTSYVVGWSKEGGIGLGNLQPHIEWNMGLPPGMVTVIIILVLVFSLIGVVTIVYQVRTKKTKSKPKSKPQGSKVYQGEPLLSPRPQATPIMAVVTKPAVQESLVFCHYCGNKIVGKNIEFCVTCGTKIKD